MGVSSINVLEKYKSSRSDATLDAACFEPGTAEAAPVLIDDLAHRLATELADSWRSGACVPAEDLLAEHPDLGDYPDAALRVVYEEICMRQELGQVADAEQFARRFPQWRKELELLLDCHSLLKPAAPTPHFPEAGDRLGDFQIVREMERGAVSRVFLAKQSSLANRPVVLKLKRCDGQEHVSLARLQHTHIVPLYAVEDFPKRNVRALCMPYQGGTTLSALLKKLEFLSSPDRRGAEILRILDQSQTTSHLTSNPRGPGRAILRRASYVEAICWIGACLADALQYAHERGLVHLDIKPANVLVTADGQPMLLDFHLAREPVPAGGPPPEWMGGTPDYMAPEQQAALAAVRLGRSIETAVDHRADIYALGVVLYEALGGRIPLMRARLLQLHRYNRDVSIGLSDLVHKCLDPDPTQRYENARELAADLRRFLSHQPLRGVRNRSFVESLRRWRSQHPYVGLAALGLLAGTCIGLLGVTHVRSRVDQAQAALTEGREETEVRRYDEAEQHFTRGLAFISGLPFTGDARQELQEGLVAVRARKAADQLFEVVGRLEVDGSKLSQPDARELSDSCQALWEVRAQIIKDVGRWLGSTERHKVHDAFVQMVLLWTQLHLQVLEPGSEDAQRLALERLAETQRLIGPHADLEARRRELLAGFTRSQ